MNKLSGLLVAPGRMASQPQGAMDMTGGDLGNAEAAAKAKADSVLEERCRILLRKLFEMNLLNECGLDRDHIGVVLGKVLQHYGVKMIEDYGQGQYEVLKYNLWRLIEWKVTMEQMEEFYTAGKTVEEMMDDIMNERVPLVHHHFVPRSSPPACCLRQDKHRWCLASAVA